MAENKEEQKIEENKEDEVVELKKTIEAQKIQLEEQEDRLKRVAAEFENYKKRSTKERETLYNSLKGDVILTILPVVDNLEKAVVAKQVTHYKEYQSLIYNGDYYRLANPFEDGMSAWSWISEDKKTILVQGVLFRAKPNVLRKTLRLMGLEAKKNYKIAGTEEVYTGVALMSGGVLLQRAVGDDVSFEIVLEEI